jgi:hypothetical protein
LTLAARAGSIPVGGEHPTSAGVTMGALSHVDDQGRARMVDVSGPPMESLARRGVHRDGRLDTQVDS